MLERLLYFIEYKGLTMRNFERIISASEGTIRKAMQRHSGISTNWLPIIADKFPELSLKWLVLGVGDMLNCQTNQININNNKINSDNTTYNNNEILALKKTIAVQERLINSLEEQLTLYKKLLEKP